METSTEEGQSLSASSAHNKLCTKRVCGPEIKCRASSIESSDHVYFFGAPQAPAAAAITSRALFEPPAATIKSSRISCCADAGTC